MKTFKLAKRKSKVHFGIDMGLSAVKAVGLHQTTAGFGLEEVAMLPVESQGDDANLGDATVAIKSFLEAWGIQHRKAVVAISANTVITRNVSLPAAGPIEMEAEMALEAARLIPYDTEEVYLDWYQHDDPVSTTLDTVSMQLVACRKSIVDSYAEAARGAGLEISTVDVDYFAMQNCFYHNYGEPGEPVALACIGAGYTAINIVHGGRSIFTRAVGIGANIYTEGIQAALGVTLELAEQLRSSADAAGSAALADLFRKCDRTIASELKKSMTFLDDLGEVKISRVYICGGGSRIPTLCAGIESAIGVPVEPLDPFRKITVDPQKFDPDYVRSLAPFVVVATGLALRGC